MEPLTPTEEQEQQIAYMLRPESQGAALNASGMGVGKTLVATEFTKRAGSKTVLIIAPLQTEDGWRKTFARQQSPLEFRVIDSTKKGKSNLAAYQWGQPGAYYVGQELFDRWSWERQPLLDRNKKQRTTPEGKPMFRKVLSKTWTLFTPDVAVFDEIHRAQNVESSTHKALMNLNAGFKVGLSGTPFGNGFDGAYAVTKWLWPHLAEKNIYDWRAKYAETVYDRFAVRNQRTVGEKNPGEFTGSLPCYFRAELDLDLEVHREKFYVELSSEQRRVYDELDAKMVAWIQDHPMVTKITPARRIRQRQATLGMPMLTPIQKPSGEVDYAVSFHKDCESTKIDKMFGEVLDGYFDSEPALILTDSQQFAEVLVHRLNERYGGQMAREWSGKVKRSVRNQDKLDFLDGQYKYVVGVITALGTGADEFQKVCRNTLFFSEQDSRIDNEQSIGRTERTGQFSSFVRFAWILARDTWDVGIQSAQMQAAIKMNKSLKRKGLGDAGR